MRTLLIDTDPGVDDALAILMAHTHPDTNVAALTTTAGNIGLAHTTRNALKLLEIIGADTPVFPGASRPLVRTEEHAAYVHGHDGFGDTGYLAPCRAPQSEHAAQAMLRLSRERPGELTFVMLGPLTNLALALTLDPTLPERVPRLVIMGGAVRGRGNLKRLPVEFNFGFDPEAADMVVSHWPRFELADWEATLAHGIPFADLDPWLAASHPRARFYAAISRKARVWMRRTRHATDWHAADGLAMAVALAPEAVVRADDRALAVELDGDATPGMSVVDWDRRGPGAANARILAEFDRARFAQLVRVAVGG